MIDHEFEGWPEGWPDIDTKREELLWQLKQEDKAYKGKQEQIEYDEGEAYDYY